jgi:hypothetical protein
MKVFGWILQSRSLSVGVLVWVDSSLRLLTPCFQSAFTFFDACYFLFQLELNSRSRGTNLEAIRDLGQQKRIEVVHTDVNAGLSSLTIVVAPMFAYAILNRQSPFDVEPKAEESWISNEANALRLA